MNLNLVAASAISAVLPKVNLVVFVSTGYDIVSNKQVPTYADPINILGNVQPMSWRDLRQVESLNLQGTQQAIFMDGRIDGIIRVDRKGGDLIVTPDGKWWLVEQPLEDWPDWCKVAATLQNGS